MQNAYTETSPPPVAHTVPENHIDALSDLLSSESSDGDDIVRIKKPKHKKQRPLNEAILDILSSKPRAESTVPILSRTIIERKLDQDQINEKTQKHLARMIKIEYSKERVKPNTEDLNYELKLRKVATRGVVKLFNAIRLAQHKVKKLKAEEPSIIPSSDSVEKLVSTTRSAFMDILRRPKNDHQLKTQSVLFSQAPSASSEPELTRAMPSNDHGTGTWNVLEDDYMLNAKLKDWEVEKEKDEMEY